MQNVTIKNLEPLAEALARALGADLYSRLAGDVAPHHLACLIRDPDWLDRGIDEGEAAEFLGYEISTLQGWRVRGVGPKFLRPSKRSIRYTRRELLAWQTRTTVQSTSQPIAAELGLPETDQVAEATTPAAKAVVADGR